jgi:hypothetical protein
VNIATSPDPSLELVEQLSDKLSQWQRDMNATMPRPNAKYRDE